MAQERTGQGRLALTAHVLAEQVAGLVQDLRCELAEDFQAQELQASELLRSGHRDERDSAFMITVDGRQFVVQVREVGR